MENNNLKFNLEKINNDYINVKKNHKKLIDKYESI